MATLDQDILYGLGYGTTAIWDNKYLPLPTKNYKYAANLDLDYPWEQDFNTYLCEQSEQQKIEAITKFAHNFLDKIKGINPKYGKLINDNFWDLI